MGSWKPSCCPFAIPTGAVVAIIIGAIVLVGRKFFTTLPPNPSHFSPDLPLLLVLLLLSPV
jgi:hypothetical protein